MSKEDYDEIIPKILATLNKFEDKVPVRI